MKRSIPSILALLMALMIVCVTLPTAAMAAGEDTSADPNDLGDGSDPGDEDNSAGGNDGDPDSAGDGLGMMDDPLGLNSVGDGSFRDDLVRMQLAALIGVPAVLL